jgi:hypothetical protein
MSPQMERYSGFNGGENDGSLTIWKMKEQGGASNGSLVENFQEANGNTGFSSSLGGEGYPGPILADVAKPLKWSKMQRALKRL